MHLEGTLNDLGEKGGTMVGEGKRGDEMQKNNQLFIRGPVPRCSRFQGMKEDPERDKMHYPPSSLPPIDLTLTKLHKNCYQVVFNIMREKKCQKLKSLSRVVNRGSITLWLKAQALEADCLGSVCGLPLTSINDLLRVSETLYASVSSPMKSGQQL